jgi:hypothetical protein
MTKDPRAVLAVAPLKATHARRTPVRLIATTLALAAVGFSGCGGSENESPASAEGTAEEEAVLEVYADYQEAILLVDADMFCEILTTGAKDQLLDQPSGRVDCETAASLALSSFSDEDRETVRSAQGKSGVDDVVVDGRSATVTTPSGNEVPFESENGEWRLDLAP